MSISAGRRQGGGRGKGLKTDLGQDDLGTGGDNLLQLVVDDTPLRINNRLVVLHIVDTGMACMENASSARNRHNNSAGVWWGSTRTHRTSALSRSALSSSSMLRQMILGFSNRWDACPRAGAGGRERYQQPCGDGGAGFQAATWAADGRTLGCCSKPAYENVFLNATPSMSCVSVMDPPLIRFMPINFSLRSSLSIMTAFTTKVLKKSLRSAPARKRGWRAHISSAMCAWRCDVTNHALVVGDELRVHGRGGALFQDVPELRLVRPVDRHRNLADPLHRQERSLAVSWRAQAGNVPAVSAGRGAGGKGGEACGAGDRIYRE